MVDIPFPVSFAPGHRPGEGSGTLVNCYAEKIGDAVIWRRTPGLRQFTRLPVSPIRGMLLVGAVLYVVAGSRVYSVGRSAAFKELYGEVPGTGPVSMARNNRAPHPQVVVVTSAGAYEFGTDVVRPVDDPDLVRPNSVSFLDGFFLYTKDKGRITSSGVNTLDVDGLAFTTAEARPDGLLRGVVHGQQLFAFGAATIEVYQNVGATPFPLARTTVIPVGLAGPYAIAGFEEGWDGPLIFVGADGSVRQMQGYAAARVSTPDVERLIAGVFDKRELVASVYTHGGNAIWSLSSSTWSLQYNVTTASWNERTSFAMPRWRGQHTVKAFNRWLIADATTGWIYELDPLATREGFEPIIFGLDSGPVKQFPVRVRVPVAALDFTLGAEVGEAHPPEVMVSYSHDGGATWAGPLVRPLVGRRQVVRVNRAGMTTAAGIRWRWRISNREPVAFLGGTMEAT